MKIGFKARSGIISSSIGILFIRFSLGSLFLLAGAEKILNLQEFIRSVQETGQMNNTLAFILAFILPFMELIFGGLYIIGLFTPVTSFFLACMSISFLFVLGIGHPELPFSYNFIFLACAISTMFTGAGLISFDAFADKKKIDELKTEVSDYKKANPSIFDAGKVNESDAVFVDENELKNPDIKG